MSSINASTSPAAIVQTADGTANLNLQTANTTALTIDASQNVGIGSTPVNSRRLTLNTSTQTDLSIVAGSTNYAQLLFGYTGADNKGIISYYNNDNSMQFYTNAAERMRIDSSGNVGIGTASPAYKLDVAGFAKGAIVHRAGTYTAGNTTPSVSGATFLNIANSSPTTITNFTNGETGQVIYLFFEDANTTVNRTNAYLAGAANFVSTANDMLVLLKTGSFWYEISRSANA